MTKLKLNRTRFYPFTYEQVDLVIVFFCLAGSDRKNKKKLAKKKKIPTFCINTSQVITKNKNFWTRVFWVNTTQRVPKMTHFDPNPTYPIPNLQPVYGRH